MNYRDSKSRNGIAGSADRQSLENSSDAQPEGATSDRYGATPEEWAHFSEGLCLTEHLLPTVANPWAKPRPGSRVTFPGKVPTMYDALRRYFGIRNWPKRRSTRDDIRQWSQEQDYGICLQARAVRGLDIDVDDQARAGRLIELADLHFGPFPQRSRKDCGRVLVPFLMDGPLRKRSVRVDGGIVEVLGDGNQFVIAGMHCKSGTRYEWQGGLPREIPRISPEAFEKFWSDVTRTYGTAEATIASLTPRRRGPTIAMADPVAQHLREHGLVLHERADGGLDVECPWSAQHSSGEPGDGSTTYFAAGTNGYAHGAFKCLHQSHGERSTHEFKRAVLYVDESDTPEVEFAGPDDSPEPPVTEVLQLAHDTPIVPSKPGRGAPSLTAIAAALRVPTVCRMRIGLDSFLGEVMLAEPADEPRWREITDVDNTRLREHLQRVCGFGSISRETMRDVVEMVAEENCFDSAQVWLNGLSWDRIPRVNTFLCRYFGCTDKPYTRAVSRYIWSAVAGRVLKPGCKADMVPVAVGKQGSGKSRAIAAMAPRRELSGELSLDLRDADTARRLRGKLIVELPELSGLTKRDAESLKALLSASSDEWVPKYKERAFRNPRRVLFFGSSNRDNFLVDETGHRRWLPFRSGQCDFKSLARDCNQLWAEGREVYVANGVEYFEAERLAREEHEAFTETDEWTVPIAAWLNGQADGGLGNVESEGWSEGELHLVGEAAQGAWPEKSHSRARTAVTVAEVLVYALNLPKGQIGMRSTMRVSTILKQLGWLPDRRQVSGVRQRVYVRPESFLE